VHNLHVVNKLSLYYPACLWYLCVQAGCTFSIAWIKNCLPCMWLPTTRSKSVPFWMGRMRQDHVIHPTYI
jgi:hypothetical protein